MGDVMGASLVPMIWQGFVSTPRISIMLDEGTCFLGGLILHCLLFCQLDFNVTIFCNNMCCTTIMCQQNCM